MEAKHTATPWSIDRYGHVQDASGTDLLVNGMGLTSAAEAKANTAFIVRACNAHDELVKALQAILPELRGLALVTPYAAQLVAIGEKALAKAGAA